MIAAGVHAVMPHADCVLVPLADGGEGTVEALVKATGGKIVAAQATDPLGNCINSFFGILGDGGTAVVEMAAASGLTLVPENLRNPMFATTYGTGELIKAALDFGCKRLILGLGGSATNDGGVGAAQALGASFRDASGREVGFGGANLAQICSIDLGNLDSRIKEIEVIVACDVTNPLTGENGASAVFGPQKGATPEMIDILDAGLRNLAEVIRKDVGIDVEKLPGAGAAGGMGAGAVAFFGANIRPGIEVVLEITRLADQMAGASLLITGEGKVDAQTLRGKTVYGVLEIARSKGVPVIVLAGGIEPEGYELLNRGATALLSIVNKPMNLSEAQEQASKLLTLAAQQATRLFLGGCQPTSNQPFS